MVIAVRDADRFGRAQILRRQIIDLLRLEAQPFQADRAALAPRAARIALLFARLDVGQAVARIVVRASTPAAIAPRRIVGRRRLLQIDQRRELALPRFLALEPQRHVGEAEARAQRGGAAPAAPHRPDGRAAPPPARRSGRSRPARACCASSCNSVRRARPAAAATASSTSAPGTSAPAAALPTRGRGPRRPAACRRGSGAAGSVAGRRRCRGCAARAARCRDRSRPISDVWRRRCAAAPGYTGGRRCRRTAACACPIRAAAPSTPPRSRRWRRPGRRAAWRWLAS